MPSHLCRFLVQFLYTMLCVLLCSGIKESKALHEIIYMVLMAGNFLNAVSANDLLKYSIRQLSTVELPGI